MKARVLVIDDERAILEMVAEALSECEYDVHTAQEAEEAEALLRHYEYALVITDLALTNVGLKGFDFVVRLAARNPRPKLIVFSGNRDPQVQSEALLQGADAFVLKPTSLKVLSRIAQDLIGHDPAVCG